MLFAQKLFTELLLCSQINKQQVFSLQESRVLLVCGFSPSGAYIVAGANDCNVYVWKWDLVQSPRQRLPAGGFYAPPEHIDEVEPAQHAPTKCNCKGGEWPAPSELCKLQGHRHDVLLLQFSHDGDGIATGSKDGTVRVRDPVQW